MSPDIVYYYYHWDHLGTTRLITSSTGTVVSRHDYEPFGVEIPPTNDTATNSHQYTGHERDQSTGYDYMHFRYYGSNIGRFMKPDNVTGSPLNPQNWNLYSYVRGNPVNYNDPTGHIVSLAKLPQPVQDQLIQELNTLTGNTYKINAAGNLELVSVGDKSSKSGTEKLNEWIASPTQYDVIAKQATGKNKEEDILRGANPKKPSNEVWLDPRDFDIEGEIKDMKGFSASEWHATTGMASTFIHEMFETADLLVDAPPEGPAPRGTSEGELNVIRSERGLPTNKSGHTVVGGFTAIRGKYFMRTFETPNGDVTFRTFCKGR